MLYPRQRQWEVRELGITVPAYKIGHHLAVRVDEWNEETLKEAQVKRGSQQLPRFTSDKGDLHAYLAAACYPEDQVEFGFADELEEEVTLASTCNGLSRPRIVKAEGAYLSEVRGVKATDSRGILKKAQRKQLARSERLVRIADRRDW